MNVKRVYVIVVCLLLTQVLLAETVIVPGTVSWINIYTNFMYYFSSDDYLHYLNERLLFSERPDERLSAGKVRENLIKLVDRHDEIKILLNRLHPRDSAVATIDVLTDQGVMEAKTLLGLLGLELMMEEDGSFRVSELMARSGVPYYRFARIDPLVLAEQLNQSHNLYFKLEETSLPLPWDFEFFEEITGWTYDSTSFFENMIDDERLSLFLAVLFRLSDHEIDFISNLQTSPKYGAWKEIYDDRKLLMGLFNLSYALRVDENGLMLPGGDKTKAFWSNLVGTSVQKSPFEFLKELALKENGKLNYYYVFTYFLAEEKRNAWCFGYDFKKVREILDRISLHSRERIRDSRISQLEDYNFFMLPYFLEVKDGAFDFPPSLSAWLAVLEERDPLEAGSAPADVFVFLKTLAELTEKNRYRRDMRKFLSIYTKFYDRPSLLTPEILSIFYQRYEDYNVVIDYCERIPIQKPETVKHFFDWIPALDKVYRTNRDMFVAIYQSIWEIFAHASRNSQEKYDFDKLLNELLDLPLSKESFTRDFFRFMQDNGILSQNLTKVEDEFYNFILTGVDNQNVRYQGAEFQFAIKDEFERKIKDLLESQEVSSFTAIYEAEMLLEQVLRSRQHLDARTRERIPNVFRLLKHPEISDSAPIEMKQKVMPYSPPALDQALTVLTGQLKEGAPREEIAETIIDIKRRYVIYQLQDYLLGIAYALNAKNENLKIFLNPNVFRLHDFLGTPRDTAWNYSGESVAKKYPGYYLLGGLSRMKITLSTYWQTFLFQGRLLYDPEHIRAVLLNSLDMYPAPRISQSHAYVALMVDLGLEMLRESKNKESLKQDLLNELYTVTTGYHYRDIRAFLDGKAENYFLSNSEIMLLGERLFLKQKHLQDFSAPEKLSALNQPEFKAARDKELDNFGSIFFRASSNLLPRKREMFPQAIADLIYSARTGGELVTEFKVKTAYLLYRQDLPPALMGYLMYEYLNTNCRRQYAQGHKKDYFNTYFLSAIFNNSHINRILKDAQRTGILRLK